MQRTIKSTIVKYITTANPTNVLTFTAENETDENKVAKILEKKYGKGKFMILDSAKSEELYHISDYVFSLFKGASPELAMLIGKAIMEHENEIRTWIDPVIDGYFGDAEG